MDVQNCVGPLISGENLGGMTSTYQKEIGLELRQMVPALISGPALRK